MHESFMEIDADGNKCWKNNLGEYHRIDGPALEYADGFKFWYVHDKLHRLDGPAIEYPNGSKYWYVNGIKVTNQIEDWMNLNQITSWPFTNEEIVLLKLTFDF